MKLRYVMNLLALSTVFLPLLLISQKVSASTTFGELQNGDLASCYSLDVIFVIDQSGTMSDINYATDPTQQRKTAVQAMVSWLGSNVLDVCKDARHQVGVISFGNEARIDLPLTMIAPDTMEELFVLEKRIGENIKADHISGTEPLVAFQQISKMFNDGKISGGGIRKRVIILLTDGLIGSDKFSDNPPLGFVYPTQVLTDYINEILPFDRVLFDREQCVSFQIDAYGKFDSVPYENLNKCYNEHLVDENGYNNSTYLYVVLMNYGNAWPPEVKRLYNDAAKSHAGEVLDVYDKGLDNRQEIPAYFSNKLSNLIGVPTGQVKCGGVAVNPYLEKATFVFYKFSPDTKVSLRYIDTNGVQRQIVDGVSSSGGFDVIDYKKYGTNERYIFNKPYPGIWFIESDQCSGNGINAFYQSAQINPGGFTLAIPSLPQYDIPPYFDKTYPTYLTYQMRNDAGEIINNSDQPYFDLRINATVVNPSGESLDYVLEWISQEQIFKATEPLQLPLPGIYRVSYAGTTKVHVGDLSAPSEVFSEVFDSEKVLFHHEGLEFTVEDVVPFAFSISKPVNEQVLTQIHGTILSGWPLPVVPIPVRVKVHGRIVDGQEDMKEFPVEQVFLDPEKAFTAWVVSADGKESAQIYLVPNPNNSEEFIGEIPWDDSQEQLTLHVKLNGEFARGYGPDFREAISVFSRRDASPFYREGFYYFLLSLAILLIILIVIYYIWMHTNPVRGTLIIFKNNVEAEKFDVFTGRRISKFKYKGRGVDLVVINVKKASKQISEENPDEQVDAVVIYGKTECKQPFNITLNPGDKAGYCTKDYDYEIKYEK
ncbi:MAG: vWA domain-containing protein [Methylococcales bacterium]|nr:vWA domain-containing protein [Methylococcales bacterium]